MKLNPHELAILKKVKCWLFDLDGTIYLGENLIRGSKGLIEYLLEKGITFYFLTNNSSRSREDYVEKLRGYGIHVEKEMVFTSGLATALYISNESPEAAIYLVGTPSLEKEFLRNGLRINEEDPEIVVLGFDTTLTYRKIKSLCKFVAEGKPYYATHPDINCPTADGDIPDIGSFIAMVAASTGRNPDKVIGKPNKLMIQTIVEQTGFNINEIAMVGDRLYTDIAMGQDGITTVLVLSGESNLDDVKYSPFQPDIIIENVSELNRILFDE